jgi:hypothetical protein
MGLSIFYGQDDKFRRLNGVFCKYKGVLQQIEAKSNTPLDKINITPVSIDPNPNYFSPQGSMTISYVNNDDLDFDLGYGYFVNYGKLLFSSRLPARVTQHGVHVSNTTFLHHSNPAKSYSSSSHFYSVEHYKVLLGKTSFIKSFSTDAVVDNGVALLGKDIAIISDDPNIFKIAACGRIIGASINKGKTFSVFDKRLTRVFGEDLESAGVKIN